MAIEFNCPSCGAAIRVPDPAAGAKGSCPTCHTKLLVPQVAPPPEPQAAPPAPAPPQPVAPSPAPFEPAPASPGTHTGQVVEPTFPQFDATPSPIQFPGPPTASAGHQPVLPERTSVARRVRRRAKGKKSGLWFPVLCGLALVGGMAWLYIMQQPSITGDRTASFIGNEALEPKLVEKNLIDVDDNVRTTVLDYFAEHRERIKSQVVETQFSATPAGLEVQILTGSQTRFVRFRIDDDLRAWYTDNYDMLESPRSKSVRKALKEFFNDWDVAIRNQQGVEDILLYRDSVGLASSVNGLGFNVCAKIDQKLYPCVYEDDGFLYFLVPPTTKKFKLVGARMDGKKSYFPGEFNVTTKTAKK